MNLAILSLLLQNSIGGGRCVQRQVVVQQEVAAVAAYVAPVAYPIPVYSSGEFERLKKLEEIAVQNAAIMQQQANIVQALTQGGQLNAGTQVSPLTQAARGIMQQSCVKCHSGPQPKGGLDMTGKLSPAQKLLIVEMSRSGAMPPPPAKPLSDDDFSQLAAWSTEDKVAARAALKAAVKAEKEATK